MDNAQAWGRYDLGCTSWVVKRRRQVERVKSILKETRIICDVSAGAGTYTFEFAKTFPLVIHCDLSIENLNDVYSQKQQKAIDNLVLIRCDYFNLPFKNTLQQLICTETLVRGRQHELLLLNSLRRALSDSGKALVDFHNWWHNPLRRLGLMPQNFGSNKSYTRKTAEKILLDAGITSWNYYSYHQEISQEKNSVFRQIIPPTRLMYLFEK
jgi:SAM-dependent methyltransferase